MLENRAAGRAPTKKTQPPFSTHSFHLSYRRPLLFTKGTVSAQTEEEGKAVILLLPGSGVYNILVKSRVFKLW